MAPTDRRVLAAEDAAKGCVQFPTLKNSGDRSIAKVAMSGCADIRRWVMKQAPTEVRRRTYAVPAVITVCVAMLSWQSARSGEKDPHEITALGVISENIREIYAREVEACYDEAGKVARGSQFLNCLQRQARSQQDILDRYNQFKKFTHFEPTDHSTTFRPAALPIS